MTDLIHDGRNLSSAKSAHMKRSQEAGAIQVVETQSAFQALYEEWDALNSRCSKGNLFTSWEWLYTWWEIYKNDGQRQLYILLYKDKNHKTLAIAPFQIINNPRKYFPCNRQLIMLGTGETDGSYVFGEYMDLLIEPGYETEVIAALSDFLYANKKCWDGLKFHQLLANSYISQLFNHYPDIRCTTKKEGFRTLIELPETYKDYLMSLRKKMRNNVTRTLSRLEAEKIYSIISVDKVEDVDGAITILADLNRARRNDLEKSSSFEQINFENYHRKLAKRLVALNNSKQGISLRVLRFCKEPVAVLYSFIDGDTIHAYQSGFEKENGHRYSLLTMMLTQEISNSIDNPSLKYFNFMYADNENTYKKRYTGNTEAMFTISYDKNTLKYKAYAFIHGPLKEWVKKLLLKTRSEAQ